MLLTSPPERPMWQLNYKSMNHQQLVAELSRISRHPGVYADRVVRIAFIATEMAVKPSIPIILAESDEPRKVTNMALTIVDGPTIKQGESLSDAVDCTGGTIVRITVPQEYTPANMTFQSSSDGNLYNDLYDAQGEEVTMVAKPDTTIIVEAPWARSLGFLKFRSGTRDAPVEQTRDTVLFAVALETAGSAA
jgi:hypothetical protein